MRTPGISDLQQACDQFNNRGSRPTELSNEVPACDGATIDGANILEARVYLVWPQFPRSFCAISSLFPEIYLMPVAIAFIIRHERNEPT